MVSDRARAALRNPSYLRVANLIGIRQLDSGSDVDQIEKYIRENGDPYENALAAANRATEQVRARSIQDLKALTTSFEQRIGQMNADFNSRYGSLQSAADARYNDLNQILLQRTNDYNTQLAASQAALDQSQQLYEDQVKLATNQANAFVPEANPSARTATAGDDRQNLFNNVRQRSKQLSDLNLLSGVGAQGNPLAGLQIA
ncbi:MAG: hypothetical protein CL859_01120 [Cyanobium sp. ARS6]|nr:hypothetical protein [Cyanobium sp. ARS6]